MGLFHLTSTSATGGLHAVDTDHAPTPPTAQAPLAVFDEGVTSGTTEGFVEARKLVTDGVVYAGWLRELDQAIQSGGDLPNKPHLESKYLSGQLHARDFAIELYADFMALMGLAAMSKFLIPSVGTKIAAGVVGTVAGGAAGVHAWTHKDRMTTAQKYSAFFSSAMAIGVGLCNFRSAAVQARASAPVRPVAPPPPSTRAAWQLPRGNIEVQPETWEQLGPTATRAQHLLACRQRAINSLARGGFRDGIAALTSDLKKHPETAFHDDLTTLLRKVGSNELQTLEDVARFIDTHFE